MNIFANVHFWTKKRGVRPGGMGTVSTEKKVSAFFYFKIRDPNLISAGFFSSSASFFGPPKTFSRIRRFSQSTFEKFS